MDTTLKFGEVRTAAAKAIPTAKAGVSWAVAEVKGDKDFQSLYKIGKESLVFSKYVYWDIPKAGSDLIGVELFRPVAKEASKGFWLAEGWAARKEAEIKGFKLSGIDIEPIKRYAEIPFATIKYGEQGLRGFSDVFVQYPTRTVPTILAGGALCSVMGGVSAAAPKLAPWIKGGMTTLGVMYAGSSVIGASMQPKEQRAYYIGQKLQPVALLAAGGYLETRISLKDMAWSQMTEHTKYKGLSKSDSQMWKWLDEGKPVIGISTSLRNQILQRQTAIDYGVSRYGYDYVKPFLTRGEELFKYDTLTSYARFTQPDYGAIARGKHIDFTLVERTKPLGELAPLRISEFLGQDKSLILGGSLVTANIFSKEASGYQLSIFEKDFEFKTLEGYKPRITLTGYEKKPSDIDVYSLFRIDEQATRFYTLLGGKKIPRTVDFDTVSSLDKYRGGALDITRQLGGRVGGGTALYLQSGDIGRGLRDIDAEFELKKGTPIKYQLGKLGETYLDKLDKRFGKGLFEMDVSSRHPKIVWTKDIWQGKKQVGTFGETFIDLGKTREGFRVREISFGPLKKKLKVMDVRDLLYDKRMIVKYVGKKDPVKGAKAMSDISHVEKALADRYKYGTFQYKADIDRAVFQTRELWAPKFDKLMEMHRVGTMLYPNIMAVTPMWKFPQKYILSSAEGIRILSPEVQMKRGVVGGFADSRYKDFPKILLAKKGEVRFKLEEMKMSRIDPLKELKLKKLGEEVKLIKELEKGQMFQLGAIELKIEPLMGTPIKIKKGKKVIDAKVPAIGNLQAFEKRFGKKGTSQLVDNIMSRKEFKGYGRKMVIEVLRKPYRLPKSGYPKYPTYPFFPFAYPAYDTYKQPYSKYPTYPKYPSYPKYTPYSPKYPTYPKYPSYHKYSPYRLKDPEYLKYPSYHKYYPVDTPGPPTIIFKYPEEYSVWGSKKISKTFKPKHKYQPSLVAGLEKITAYKIPKRLTGLEVRPIVRL